MSASVENFTLDYLHHRGRPIVPTELPPPPLLKWQKLNHASFPHPLPHRGTTQSSPIGVHQSQHSRSFPSPTVTVFPRLKWTLIEGSPVQVQVNTHTKPASSRGKKNCNSSMYLGSIGVPPSLLARDCWSARPSPPPPAWPPGAPPRPL